LNGTNDELIQKWHQSLTKAEGTFLILELLFGFAGSQLIAQDVRKDDEQSQCCRTKADNVKVLSRTFFLMFRSCKVKTTELLSVYFCISLVLEVFSLLTSNFFFTLS